MKHNATKTITRRPNGTTRVQTINLEESKTQQQFAAECDINNIIGKYIKTGELTHLARKNGVFADVSEITDYRESLDKITAAENAFMALDANIRNRFQNDPEQLLRFLQDPRNYDEGIQLGLYDKRTDPPQIKTNEQTPTNEKKPKQKGSTPPTEPE